MKAYWRLDCVLKLLPLKVKPYTGSITYFFNNDSKIYKHLEEWDTDVVDLLISCVIPGFGAPPAPPVDVLRQQWDKRLAGVQPA